MCFARIFVLFWSLCENCKKWSICGLVMGSRTWKPKTLVKIQTSTRNPARRENLVAITENPGGKPDLFATWTQTDPKKHYLNPNRTWLLLPEPITNLWMWFLWRRHIDAIQTIIWIRQSSLRHPKITSGNTWT